MAETQQMSMEVDAVETLKRAIVNMVTVKTKDFGNARDVRKLLDKIRFIRVSMASFPKLLLEEESSDSV